MQIADQPVGPYRVTVFTSPSPLKAHIVTDVSVVVTDSAGKSVPDAAVDVAIAPAGSTLAPAHTAATHELATNKQFYAANVTFPTAGTWNVVVRIAGPAGGGDVHFTSDVSPNVFGFTPLGLVLTLCFIGAVAVMLVVALRFKAMDQA